MLHWFRHVERTPQERLTKLIHNAKVEEGSMGQGRSQLSFHDQIGCVPCEGEVKSFQNRCECMERVMKVQEVWMDRNQSLHTASYLPSFTGTQRKDIDE